MHGGINYNFSREEEVFYDYKSITKIRIIIHINIIIKIYKYIIVTFYHSIKKHLKNLKIIFLENIQKYKKIFEK